MGKIKFRVWIENSRYIYPNRFTFFEDVIYCYDSKGDYEYQVSINEVEQYIGRVDSDGEEIFKGDIISYEDGFFNSEGDTDTFINNGLVDYDDDNACYVVSNRQTVEMDDLWLDKIKVIGNIRENPSKLNLPY